MMDSKINDAFFAVKNTFLFSFSKKFLLVFHYSLFAISLYQAMPNQYRSIYFLHNHILLIFLLFLFLQHSPLYNHLFSSSILIKILSLICTLYFLFILTYKSSYFFFIVINWKWISKRRTNDKRIAKRGDIFRGRK